MLATLGMLLALWWFGTRKCKTVGGISGGAIPQLLFAAGFSVKEIVELAINLDFQSLLDQGEKISRVMLDHYSGSRHTGDLPGKGKFKMDRFESWLEAKLNGVWPRDIEYWTMATDEKGAQILLTREGAFRREESGTFVQISKSAPPLGKSICATCTVPGVFTPIEIVLDSGARLKLWDGALSWEAMRPITLVEEFYGATAGDIIVCDVGAELNAYDRLYNSIWKLLCGGRCVPPKGRKNDNEEKMLLVLPAVMAVRTFEFAAHSDKKWAAIMEGFAATVDALNKTYRLTNEQYLQGKSLVTEFNRLLSICKKAKPGTLSERTEALLIDRGVL